MSQSTPTTAQPEVASPPLDVEKAVLDRYSEGAKAPQAALCCPTSYDRSLLEIIPKAVLEVDYGCGDPTQHVKAGETVLDLGSGSGKHCFMVSQVVGAEGEVIGVDMNDDMLALARENAPVVGEKVGYENVRFVKGSIQDLATDPLKVDALLAERAVRSAAELEAVNRELEQLRASEPLIADGSVDVVISNCVLNLVRPDAKRQLFKEIHRVLARGGRAVISDIVSDEDVPQAMQDDPELWSGCISGAFREDHFLTAFEEAGFYGIQVLERQVEPWQIVEGIEFRSLTVVAYKGKEGACWDQKHAVIYKGPFSSVTDDDGHEFQRGIRTAVCEKTYRLMTREPYAEHMDPIEPAELIALEDAPAFACTGGSTVRHPRETKSGEKITTQPAASTCEPSDSGSNGSCC